ncbi:MAG: DUF4129 domain-containing protein [Planctomycetota bacterium]
MALFGVLLWFLIAAPDTAAITDARRAVYERGGYQSTIPDRQADATPSSESRSSSRRSRARTTPSRREPVGTATIGEAVLGTLAVVLGALALFWIATVWRERRRVALAVKPAPAPVASPQAVPEEPLCDAEKLARAGDYTGAIHATLLLVLAAFADQLQPAWTSREVTRTIPREEFAHLVELVERTLFGGRAATRDDYERARAWGSACRPRNVE